jgi:hypothetical protein
MLNFIPRFVLDRDFVKAFEYRPQVAWLPLVPNRGTGHVLPQEFKYPLPKEKYQVEYRQAAAI